METTAASSSGSGSTSYYYYLTVYNNLSTPIVIPANDSVLVDLTFSAGDISSVSQV